MLSFIKKEVENPYHLFHMLACKNKLNWMSDKLFLSTVFRGIFNKKLNLDEPVTFNEKLQWLKLYNRKPEYTLMVDKYEVKQYVAKIIGDEYIIPTYGVWNHFDEINFDILPDQFVLKCTHDSGGLVICKNKELFDYEMAKKKIERCLGYDFYYYGREWPYKDVQHRIIAEKYMEDDSGELKDYKFFCFNGVMKCFKVDFDRFVNHHANYYNAQNELMHFGENSCPPDYDRHIEMPASIEKMKELAERLSVGVPFLRVDFYDVKGSIYFGELTFFPASGFGSFNPPEYDQVLGEWLKLPNG